MIGKASDTQAGVRRKVGQSFVMLLLLLRANLIAMSSDVVVGGVVGSI
jgi:hypothetical protein